VILSLAIIVVSGSFIALEAKDQTPRNHWAYLLAFRLLVLSFAYHEKGLSIQLHNFFLTIAAPSRRARSLAQAILRMGSRLRS
jgi:hypothetical protein